MVKEYIHINDLRKLLNSHQEIENLKCWKLDGSIMNCNKVICSSSHFPTNTFNLRFLVSNETRTIKGLLIFEINGMEVIL